MNGQLVADFEKHYPLGATVRASFSQPAQGFHATVVFGPSGSGKTTVLRCLAGLERPQQGSIRIGDQTWFDAHRGVHLRPQQRGVGFLFQDYALFPHLTVEKNIGFGLKRVAPGERRRRVAALMEMLGLSGLHERYPRQLSAGQQQRVALARAVAPRPRLLLLDEPLSALDTPTRQTLRGELRRILVEIDTPAVIVTHDPIEAVSLADQAVVLADGVVRQAGPIHEVFSRPIDPVVARTVGIETIHPAQLVAVSEGLATVRAGTAELLALSAGLAPGPVYVCIRGEDVTLERNPEPQTTARNRLPGRIVSLLPEGPLLRVLLECGFPLTALITRPAADQLGLQPGDQVIALIKAPAIHLVPRT
jgi:molybdate transport system ATP-binding protein